MQAFNALLALYSAIIIHELGHVLACAWYGVAVDEVSIGFGKLLLSFGILKIRLVPLGGYTIIRGLEDSVPPAWAQPQEYFCMHKISTQRIIILAGIAANMALAAVSFFYLNPIFWKVNLLLGSYQLLPFKGTDGWRLIN